MRREGVHVCVDKLLEDRVKLLGRIVLTRMCSSLELNRGYHQRLLRASDVQLVSDLPSPSTT